MISGKAPGQTRGGKPKVAGFETAAILMKPARKVEIESALAAALDPTAPQRSDERTHVSA
jgi:hypothetical protein